MSKNKNSKTKKKQDGDYLVKIISVQISICLMMFLLIFIYSKFGGQGFDLALNEYKKLTDEDLYSEKIKDAIFKTKGDSEKEDSEKENSNKENKTKDKSTSILIDDETLKQESHEDTKNIDFDSTALSPLSLSFNTNHSAYNVLQSSLQTNPCIPIENTKITSDFGYRQHPITKKYHLHSGTDFGADEGDYVRAALNGKVITAKYSDARGNYIVIEHTKNIKTYYCHNSKLLAKEGTIVRAGETIALAGSTGDATGPHVHFEVHVNGKPKDPMKVLFTNYKFS